MQIFPCKIESGKNPQTFAVLRFHTAVFALKNISGRVASVQMKLLKNTELKLKNVTSKILMKKKNLSLIIRKKMVERGNNLCNIEKRSEIWSKID